MPKELFSLSQKQFRRQISKNIENHLKSVEIFSFHHFENTNEPVTKTTPEAQLLTIEAPNYDLNISSESTFSLESEFSNLSLIDSESGSIVTAFDIKTELRAWSVQNNITHESISKLLKLLRLHPCFTSELPSDARSLLKTPRTINSTVVLPGNYVHFGLEKGILAILKSTEDLHHTTLVEVFISVDGIPVSDSSKSEFWPILCSIENVKNNKPFCVGIYHGSTKPANHNDFLEQFVTDAKDLSVRGIYLEIKPINSKLRVSSVTHQPDRSLLVRYVCMYVLVG